MSASVFFCIRTALICAVLCVAYGASATNRKLFTLMSKHKQQWPQTTSMTS